MEDNEKNLIDIKQFVILVDNRGQQRLLKPSQHKNFKWRKISVKLQQQLGEFEYYQTIEVGNDKLKAVEQIFQEEHDQAEVDEDQLMENTNNKQIYTLEQAQKLQAKEIEDLKVNKKGEEIIQTITENNEQFEKRTIYSKEKYLSKKKKKYLFQFHVEPTSLQNVHKFYFLTEPKSVNWMRWDILALFLLHSGPFGRVLLAEKTKGLMLGGILTRNCLSITSVAEQVRNMKRYPIVEQLNISKQVTREKVQFVDWKSIKQDSQKQGENVRFDNLILVGNYDFAGIFTAVLPLLENNCLIGFYCQNIEPLQPALEAMRSSGAVIHTKILDSWAREYQVLKNRTHPMMYMSSHSGYMLIGIRVEK